MNNKFPVDIFGVKEYGIDKWHKEFFWPVSDTEFHNLYRDIDQCVIDEIKKQPLEVKTLLIIHYENLIVEYINFLHALKVMNILKQKEIDILYFDKTWWYKNILTDSSYIDIHVARINEIFSFMESLKKQATLCIKTLAKTLLYNRFNLVKYLMLSNNKKVTKTFGPRNSIIKQYMRKWPRWIYYTSYQDWISKNDFSEISSDLANSIKQCVENIIGNLCLIAEKNNIALLENHIKHLRQFTENEFIDTAKILQTIEKRLKKNNKKIHLLVSGIGGPVSRAISIALQRNGGKVTAFIHGGDIGFLNSPAFLISFFDIPLANDYATYTSKSAELYERLKANYSHCNNKLNIISGKSDEYFKTWKRYGNAPLPEKNKRIMIIGYPYNQWRSIWVTGGFSLMRLDLELRLIGFLKKTGYEILYKMHPYRIAEAKGIFESRVRILKGFFENNLDKADAFLFPSITTTAFATALCTNKPIITFDLSFKLFEPFRDAMELFKKRCSIVSTKFDERNRIIFDEKQLLDVLSQKPGNANTEFIETYMFPEKI